MGELQPPTSPPTIALFLPHPARGVGALLHSHLACQEGGLGRLHWSLGDPVTVPLEARHMAFAR